MSDAAQHDQLLRATRTAAVATITAALITAAGRPHSVDEAIALYNDVYLSLTPEPQSGRYQAWQQSKQTDKPHT